MSLDLSLKTDNQSKVKPDNKEIQVNGKRAEAPQPVQALHSEVATSP